VPRHLSSPPKPPTSRVPVTPGPEQDTVIDDMSMSDIYSAAMKRTRAFDPPPPELTPIGFEVLLSLAARPLHGYGIKLAIEERTAGEISLGSGTLYQAIHRLERERLIAEARDSAALEDARRGRTYRIEPLGRTSLANHLRRLSRALEYARANRLLPSSKS